MTRVATALVAAVALAIVGVLGVPQLLGLRPLTVASGSMAPALAIGDVVVTRPVAPAALAVDDVVTFPDPGGSGRLVTHRVLAVSAPPGSSLASLVTKGDANAAVERFSVPADAELGRVAYRVPKVGLVMARLRGVPPALLTVALPALALALMLVTTLLRGAAPAPARGRGGRSTPRPVLGRGRAAARRHRRARPSAPGPWAPRRFPFSPGEG